MTTGRDSAFRTSRTTTQAPVVVEGTAPSQTPEAAQLFAENMAATQIDPRIWTGAFATNVWGGRYAVDSVLGEGSQGSTFVGTDLKTGVRVALKVFDLGRARDWKSAQLFDREVETLKNVEHPGIPQFLDVVVDDDTGARAIVRTLIPGDSLAHVQQQEGPLGEAALWRVLVDVVQVLSALHERPSPIIHRDIKPQNLIRTPDGKTCVVDFGGVGHVRDTAGSTVVGTFGYMAPEQLYGAQTPATDVYALGATLLFLATGIQPEDLPRNGLAVDVDASCPRLSPKLRTLLTSMLRPDPTQRPSSARALQAELDRLSQVPTEPAREPDEVLSDVLPIAPSLSSDSSDRAQMLYGLVQTIAGWLGAVGTVVVGQLLLPFLFTVLGAMSSGAQREKLFALREKIREASVAARKGFWDSATQGQRMLEDVQKRQTQDHTRRRKMSRAERRREKAESKRTWLELKRVQEEQWRTQKKIWKESLKEQFREQKRMWKRFSKDKYRF